MPRPIRIANCSGALTDPGVHMYNQARYGQVDVITGDYLAEANLAESTLKNAPHAWVNTAYEGIKMSLDVINEKRIKVIVNGGALDPKGLAEEINKLVSEPRLKNERSANNKSKYKVKEKRLHLTIAYVQGDDLMHKVHTLLKPPSSSSSSLDKDSSPALHHLDHDNPSVTLDHSALSFLQHPDTMPIVSANAYLGYRAIKHGLDQGADIIICGRVADASPVIAAAAWWHAWDPTDYDRLAAALVGGHLIECSTYVTGGNFSGAYRYPAETFVNLGLPIVEVAGDGVCVVTKTEGTGGLVTADTVKCQFLYELQGDVYLNSDVKADVSGVKVKEVAKDRVRVEGVRGFPPPPTTKLAVFYRGGYQNELLLNASGYATSHKWDVQELQVREKLREWQVLDKLDVLDFQRVGVPMENPDSQLASTTYMRIFAQSRDKRVVSMVAAAWNFTFMTHFAGMHGSLDWRTAAPKPFLAYYPAIVPQTEIEESISIIQPGGIDKSVVGPPVVTEPLQARANYETAQPLPLDSFGPTISRPLGDIALGRSGDKGANVNLGLFVEKPEQWDWLRSFMTRQRLKQMMGRDWRDRYFIERVEMPNIHAVHFVIYGPLGRGVSSSKLLDCLGKGFAEYIRAIHVPIPTKFLPRAEQAKL
ncbi:unnamed protein product [Clonostachys rosea f. rosea IK726]|uniref:Uncharacterized protein n=1 Tax=Clonostachys rosea f. rosea IK726 TaxID=1349383 RepID=A0ACA9UKJ5_BIOOC|nr:unnamed protein product [Clonostachys rosea f. rosea IK726]